MMELLLGTWLWKVAAVPVLRGFLNWLNDLLNFPIAA